jgi:hypothetical protein
MQSHSTGPIAGSRLGAIRTVQSFLIAAAALPAPPVANIKLCTIKATAQNPVVYYPRIINLAVFNSTTNTIGLGTTSGSVNIIGATDIKTGALANTTSTNAGLVAVTDTDIWITLGGTGPAPTTGQAIVIVEMHDLNVATPEV